MHRRSRLAALVCAYLPAVLGLAACATTSTPRLVDFASSAAPAPDRITPVHGLYLVPNPSVRDSALERAVRERLAAELLTQGWRVAGERDADVYVVLDVKHVQRTDSTGAPLWESTLSVLAVDGATYRRTNGVHPLWRAEARTRAGRKTSPEQLADALVQPTLAFFGRASNGAVRVQVAAGG